MDLPDAPESIEAAQAELERLMAWGESLNQMQAQVPQANARASFLQGWLSGQPKSTSTPKPTKPTPNRAARRKTGPTKARAKT